MSVLRRIARPPLLLLGFIGRVLVAVVMALVIVATWLLKAAIALQQLLATLFRIVLGGWLFAVPGMHSGPAGVVLRLTLFVVRYLVFWGAVWWLQWYGLSNWWDSSATWFVDSRAGLQTALQVLPATLVAVLVFILGSVFVVAQLAITAYGQRAATVLGLDYDIHIAIVRPLLLTAGALLLAGQVPDDGVPSAAVTAAVATLVIATVFLFFLSASLIVGLLTRYTAPLGFPLHVVEPVYDELLDGSTIHVVLRGPLLGEALKAALRRGDSVAVGSTLEAIVKFQDDYFRALADTPSIRVHPLEDGSMREHWLAEDLTSALVAAGEDALRMLAAGGDTNAIARALGSITARFIRDGDNVDADICITGLVELATTVHQITAGGVANYYAEPTAALAGLERIAEAEGDSDTAAHALAGWLLSVAYTSFHFGLKKHSLWDRSIADLGPSPPWQAARAMVQTAEWQRTWANKQYRGPGPLIQAAGRAQRDHARRGH